MHITAAKPTYISSSILSEVTLMEKREAFRLNAFNEGKNEKIIEKVVEGKIQKFIKETCLKALFLYA